jgi:hypothetical protein
VIVFDGLLRHVGQHRIGAPERHHRHLAEEHGDLAENVGLIHTIFREVLPIRNFGLSFEMPILTSVDPAALILEQIPPDVGQRL